MLKTILDGAGDFGFSIGIDCHGDLDSSHEA